MLSAVQDRFMMILSKLVRLELLSHIGALDDPIWIEPWKAEPCHMTTLLRLWRWRPPHEALFVTFPGGFETRDAAGGGDVEALKGFETTESREAEHRDRSTTGFRQQNNNSLNTAPSLILVTSL